MAALIGLHGWSPYRSRISASRTRATKSTTPALRAIKNAHYALAEAPQPRRDSSLEGYDEVV